MSARQSATGNKSNRRRREAPTRAYFDVSNWPRWLVLIVDDVVTKNERHRAVTIHGSKKTGTKDRASVIESAVADAFKEAVRDAVLAAAVRGFAGTAAGAWSLELLSVWPTQRHLPDGLDVPFGDSDSPLSLVRDALQYAGVVDNDIRIVADRTVHHYCKGVRRIVACLRPSNGADLRLASELLALGANALRDHNETVVKMIANEADITEQWHRPVYTDRERGDLYCAEGELETNGHEFRVMYRGNLMCQGFKRDVVVANGLAAIEERSRQPTWTPCQA